MLTHFFAERVWVFVKTTVAARLLVQVECLLQACQFGISFKPRWYWSHWCYFCWRQCRGRCKCRGNFFAPMNTERSRLLFSEPKSLFCSWKAMWWRYTRRQRKTIIFLVSLLYITCHFLPGKECCFERLNTKQEYLVEIEILCHKLDCSQITDFLFSARRCSWWQALRICKVIAQHWQVSQAFLANDNLFGGTEYIVVVTSTRIQTDRQVDRQTSVKATHNLSSFYKQIVREKF